MDNWILALWLVSCLCWINPIKGRNWQKRNVLGLIIGVTLNTALIYLCLPTLIAVNILLFLAINIMAGVAFHSIAGEFNVFTLPNGCQKKLQRFFLPG